jgi:TolB-like protein/tetratricopeptide (TPR) repeat protein
MTAEERSDSQVEIGHVLFIDIVGFSKLLGDQQTGFCAHLNQTVRQTDSFRAADASGRLLRLPTGDGMALIFFTGPEAPLQCAVEVSRLLKASIALRMGIHSGPVNKTRDVDGRINVTGSGINMAQRLMDCADAGHILLSKRVAEDLAQYSKWQPYLHELGQTEVKHGAKIDIFNFYTDDIGNTVLPEKLKGKRITRASGFTRFVKPIVAAVFVIGIALVLWFFARRGGEGPAIFPGKSVAVLPFKPLVANSRDEVLEAGMADTLIVKLSTSREIFVPSLTSVRKYDDPKHDSVATGRALHVNSVLEGNLQKVGDRIRVTARLINVADGTSIWSGKFDEKFTDVFGVQDAIAEKVATALAVPLNEEDRKRLTKRYTDNTEAYQLYLTGRFYWNKYSEEGYRKSIESFKRATEKDPNYALAYSGLADSYSLLGEMGMVPANETFPQGRAYAEKALKLDDTLSEAHLSLGIVKLFYDWDFAGAGKELLRAKELDPKNAQVYHFYGHYLELTDRFDEAITETKRGVQLEPTNLIINSEVGYACYVARRPDAAIEQLRKTLELDPTFSYASYVLAQAYEQKRAYEGAITELNRARPISADWSFIVADLGYVDALLGKRSEAEKIIEELKERTAQEYIDPVLIAYIYIALGDKDEAFAWMDKAYQERSGLFVWLQIEPKFDPIRSDPRFDELVRRMGLK